MRFTLARTFMAHPAKETINLAGPANSGKGKLERGRRISLAGRFFKPARPNQEFAFKIREMRSRIHSNW
jgi:hypothetical protein